MTPWRGERTPRRTLRLSGDAAMAAGAFALAFLARIYLPIPFTRVFCPKTGCSSCSRNGDRR